MKKHAADQEFGAVHHQLIASHTPTPLLEQGLLILLRLVKGRTNYFRAFISKRSVESMAVHIPQEAGVLLKPLFSIN